MTLRSSNKAELMGKLFTPAEYGAEERKWQAQALRDAATRARSLGLTSNMHPDLLDDWADELDPPANACNCGAGFSYIGGHSANCASLTPPDPPAAPEERKTE